MHINENCTKLSKVALDGIKELGQNALLLCNLCVILKKRDKLIESANASRQHEALDDQKLKALQADFNEMMKTTSEIKVIEKNAMPSPPSIPKQIEITKPEPKELDGVAKSTAKSPRERNDLSVIYNLLKDEDKHFTVYISFSLH